MNKGRLLKLLVLSFVLGVIGIISFGNGINGEGMMQEEDVYQIGFLFEVLTLINNIILK